MILSSFWTDYETRLTINGDSSRDREITVAKESFIGKVIDSPAYKPSSTVNGAAQAIVIDPTSVFYKAKVIAMPGDSLTVGDLIVDGNDKWLIVETKTSNPIQISGKAWLCNQKFRFQNSTTSIIEVYGVLDNGNYATSGDKQIQYVSDKFKVYMPYDLNTKKIFIDKRLATNKVYNNEGKEILVCYTVKGFDAVSESYGQGGHLLILNVETSGYDSTKDNITELICDYIESTPSGGTTTPTLLPCSITTARTSIRTGMSYTYAVTFYKANGTTVDSAITAVWTTPTISGITFTPNGNSIKIAVAADEALVGETFTISVTDTGGLYNTATYNVEVI